MATYDHDAQQESSSVQDAYEKAVAKIEQLESQLQQKEKLLDINLKEQTVLRERLMACIKTIRDTTNQLNNLERELKDHYRHILIHVDDLEKENRELNLSNDAWSNRSIKLEFEVLTAQDQVQEIKKSHEFAVSKIAQLEMELKSIRSEKNLMRRRGDNLYSR